MRKNPVFVIVLFGAILLISCEQERLAVPEIEMKEIWDCNKAQNLDSIKLASRLVGSWTWKKQFCYWTGKTTYADKEVKVTFTELGTYILLENSAIVSQGSWKLKIVDSNMLGLDISESSLYLFGRVLVCDDDVLFNGSYIDVCDNLFTKTD